jgi:hypothetical protein
MAMLKTAHADEKNATIWRRAAGGGGGGTFVPDRSIGQGRRK